MSNNILNADEIISTMKNQIKESGLYEKGDEDITVLILLLSDFKLDITQQQRSEIFKIFTQDQLKQIKERIENGAWF